MKKTILIATLLTLALLNSGCGTVMGKTASSNINPDFNINEYKRVYTEFDNADILMLPVEVFFFDTLKKQSLNNKYFKKGDLYVYSSTHEGFCLPPRFNPRIMSLQFTFPRIASVKVEDAITRQVLLEVHYKRALLSTGAGYFECEKMIMEELEKAFVKSRGKMISASKEATPKEQP